MRTNYPDCCKGCRVHNYILNPKCLVYNSTCALINCDCPCMNCLIKGICIEECEKRSTLRAFERTQSQQYLWDPYKIWSRL